MIPLVKERFAKGKYTAEPYPANRRFHMTYAEINNFLSASADRGKNEHFHWGRFEWMMTHTMLDVNQIHRVVSFKDTLGEIKGLLTFDTEYDNRWYLIHRDDDSALIAQMLETAQMFDGNEVVFKVNSADTVLDGFLRKQGFLPRQRTETVLQFDLNQDLSYELPDSYRISPVDFVISPWNYQMLIHRGFGGEGTPEPWDPRVFEPTPNYNNALKVFVLKDGIYCAHCGVWYNGGDTAYIEPVVTDPDYRRLGLAKSAVYEALSRAKAMGAKRAIVISDQPFYYKIGFFLSSHVISYQK